MFYAISESFASLNDFMTAGGPVLWLIAFLAFFMWALIIERIWYFNSGHNTFMSTITQKWDSISDHTSWESSQIKEKLRSEAKEEIAKHMSLIQTCVALAPLFGLLGTVTGMIEVFQVMAFTGGGDARSMAGGVSKSQREFERNAELPTPGSLLDADPTGSNTTAKLPVSGGNVSGSSIRFGDADLRAPSNAGLFPDTAATDTELAERSESNRKRRVSRQRKSRK